MTQLIKVLLVIGILLALLHAVLVYSSISFTSEKARTVLVEQINRLALRKVVIDGDVKITVSLLPELLVQQIQIKNVEGFDEENFVTISEVRVRIALLPLLTGDLHLEELEANHASVSLIRKPNGKHNWSFEHLLQETELTNANDKGIKQDREGTRLQISVFKLIDVAVSYQDESDDHVIGNHLERLVVDLTDIDRPNAELIGSVLGYAYDINLESEALNMLAVGQPWKATGTGTIADRETKIDAVIQVDQQSVKGTVAANVQDINLGLLLAQMGIITGVDAAGRELNIKAELKGDDITQAIKNADIELWLEDGYWKGHALTKDEFRELTFSNAFLRASWNKPVELHLDGRLSDERLRIDLSLNELSEFFGDVDKLDIDFKAHAAASDIALEGVLDLPIQRKQFQLNISLQGSDLEKLNSILNSELPPFKNYRLAGEISANEKGYIVRADDATIGDTHFKTAIVIDTSAVKPFWIINLDSRQLQIRDFEFADEMITKHDPQTIKISLQKASGVSAQKPGRRLLQIVDNPKMHFDLNVQVDRVLAGENVLGSSSFKLKLREDSLMLQDAELVVPGGKIESTASFTIQNNEVKGVLKLDIDKFESGIIARYLTQGSREGGLVSARIDLELGGKNFARLFDHATGKLDVAFWPGNINANIFNLWATNLFLVILPEIKKKESRINCLVALMDLEDGIMKEDFFGIDTTKVWMHGNITVDFANEHVTLSLYPRSKTARFFSVQAPIRAEGNFDNIRLVTNPVDIAAAYVSFITSPLHVPARWVFGDKVPEDASTICEQFYDREYVRQLKAKLEAEEHKDIEEWLESD